MYASDYRRLARESLAGNWGLSVAVALVASLLGGLVGGGSVNIDLGNLNEIQSAELQQILSTIATFLSLLSLAQFIIGGVIELGHCTYLLKQHDRKDFRFEDLFSQFDRFGAGFCLKLLTALFTFLWSLLFIVPGIIAGYSYAMAPFILAEHPEYSAREAITASKEMMRGHRFELFCLELSFIGWALLCVLTLGIGTLFLNPYTSAARAAFYRALTAQDTIV